MRSETNLTFAQIILNAILSYLVSLVFVNIIKILLAIMLLSLISSERSQSIALSVLHRHCQQGMTDRMIISFSLLNPLD